MDRDRGPGADGGTAVGSGQGGDASGAWPDELSAALGWAARHYVHARRRPVAGSAFAGFFRRDVAAMARAAAAVRPERLMVRASTGAPGWAAVPWVAWFAPHVTRSMRHGLYVVAFVDARHEAVVLSLQHGAADALRLHGPVAGLEALRHQARATRDALPGHGFDTRIVLGAQGDLPRGYEAGSALSRHWTGPPDPEGFGAALAGLLDLYRGQVGP